MYGGKARGLPERGWGVAEIFIVPLGTGRPTVRDTVRAAYEIVRASGMRHELTAMGTLVEGKVEDIFDLARRMHEACFDAAGGAPRVVTSLRIDERRGQPLTLEGKVRGVLSER